MEKLNIISVESKNGANGTFVRANTNKGYMSAFEEPAKTLILQSIGKQLMCEITPKQSGDKTYNNITNAELCDQTAPIPQQEAMPADTQVPEDKHKTMYTAYAKDIFVSLLESITKAGSPQPAEEMMKKSIELIKQARDAF